MTSLAFSRLLTLGLLALGCAESPREDPEPVPDSVGSNDIDVNGTLDAELSSPDQDSTGSDQHDLDGQLDGAQAKDVVVEDREVCIPHPLCGQGGGWTFCVNGCALEDGVSGVVHLLSRRGA